MVFLYIFLALVLILISILLVIYFITFYSPHKNQNDPYNFPKDEDYEPLRLRAEELIGAIEKEPYEDVYIKVKGIKLHARYYHKVDNGVLDIGVHGYRGTAYRDFCGGSKTSFSLGHNFLLIDQRGQGLSGGHTITFGVKEKHDLVAWINYAINRFGKELKINLYGVSMGASTVLMASGLNLPKNVVSILADSPFDLPKDVICSTISKMGLPVKLAYPFVYLSALIFGGFNLNCESCTESVKKSQIPTVIMHGEIDKIVPCNMSEKIANANPIIKRYTFENAGHVMSYLIHYDRYAEIAEKLLDT